MNKTEFTGAHNDTYTHTRVLAYKYTRDKFLIVFVHMKYNNNPTKIAHHTDVLLK